MVPSVSVIVPCYNQAQFLSEALDSVLKQTYKNWECIIVNDGSSDNTQEIALSFCTKDERFKYIYKKNEDVSAARNAGIKEALGIYILPLDGDDKISANYIEEAIKAITNEKVSLVYCKADFFGDKIGSWELPEYSLEKLMKHNIIFVSALFRKADWEAVGGFDTNVNGAEDWEFWISILKKGGSVVCLPFVGFYYRQKSISKFTNVTESDRLKHKSYVYKKHADLLLELYGNPVDLRDEIDKLGVENKIYRDFYIRTRRSPLFHIYYFIRRSLTSIQKIITDLN